MQKLMNKVHDEAREIKRLKEVVKPKLEKQLAETTGLFKGRERKALQEKIAAVQQEIDRRLDRIPGILKDDGYPDAQAFVKMYNKATELVEQYNRDLAAWEQQINASSLRRRGCRYCEESVGGTNRKTCNHLTKRRTA